MLRLNHEHVENGIKESGLKLCEICNTDEKQVDGL